MAMAPQSSKALLLLLLLLLMSLLLLPLLLLGQFSMETKPQLQLLLSQTKSERQRAREPRERRAPWHSRPPVRLSGSPG
jgi:hypothetical protein